MRRVRRAAAAGKRFFGKRELARNSAWSLASAGVTGLALIVETIILARYLGPDQLGVFLLVLAYPEALQQLLDFRVRDAMTKYLGEFLAQTRLAEAVGLVKLLWIVDVAVSAIAFLIVVVTAGIAADLILPDEGVTDLMRIYAIGVFFASLDSASGPVLRVMDRFGLVFIGALVGYGGRVAFIAAVVGLGGGLEALVWARVAGELLVTLVLGAAALAVLRPLLWEYRKTPMSILQDRSREIRNFLFSTNAVGIVRLASTKLDTLLVGILASPNTVGIYKTALAFGKAPLLVSDALYLAVFPAFARDYARGNVRRIRQNARQASIYVVALALPVAIFVAFNGDALIAALLGDSFRDAGTSLVICLLGVMPYVCLFWLSPLLLVTDHAGTLLRIVALGAAVQVGTIVVLVPALGAAGAATGFALNYWVVVGLGMAFVRQRKLLADE